MLSIGLFLIVPSFAQNDEAAALNAKVIELYRAGKFSEAIPLAQRALVIREKVLGPDHHDVATSLNNEWKTIPLGARMLTEKVAAFRRGLDVDELTKGANAGNPLLFDLGLAHELYAHCSDQWRRWSRTRQIFSSCLQAR
jgi:hypothetical protein